MELRFNVVDRFEDIKPWDGRLDFLRRLHFERQVWFRVRPTRPDFARFNWIRCIAIGLLVIDLVAGQKFLRDPLLKFRIPGLDYKPGRDFVDSHVAPFSNGAWLGRSPATKPGVSELFGRFQPIVPTLFITDIPPLMKVGFFGRAQPVAPGTFDYGRLFNPAQRAGKLLA